MRLLVFVVVVVVAAASVNGQTFPCHVPGDLTCIRKVVGDAVFREKVVGRDAEGPTLGDHFSSSGWSDPIDETWEEYRDRRESSVPEVDDAAQMPCGREVATYRFVMAGHMLQRFVEEEKEHDRKLTNDLMQCVQSYVRNNTRVVLLMRTGDRHVEPTEHIFLNPRDAYVHLDMALAEIKAGRDGWTAENILSGFQPHGSYALQQCRRAIQTRVLDIVVRVLKDKTFGPNDYREPIFVGFEA